MQRRTFIRSAIAASLCVSKYGVELVNAVDRLR